MLQRAGVQLLPFSPLHDSSLPPGLSAVLLGGGAVPAHARELAANAPMLQALRAFAHAGGYVLGEADGLMYLSQSLQLARHDAAATQAAQCHAMGACAACWLWAWPPAQTRLPLRLQAVSSKVSIADHLCIMLLPCLLCACVCAQWACFRSTPRRSRSQISRQLQRRTSV